MNKSEQKKLQKILNAAQKFHKAYWEAYRLGIVNGPATARIDDAYCKYFNENLHKYLFFKESLDNEKKST